MKHISEVLRDGGALPYKLILFDVDDTLIRSFMREGYRDRYMDVEVLPGRVEALEALRGLGVRLALVTNQGGVAFGYQNIDQVYEKITVIQRALGFDENAPMRAVAGGRWPEDAPIPPPFAYVSLKHPRAKVRQYLAEVGDDWRKPGGGMIVQAMADYGAAPGETLYVGDMDTDRQAAEAAGVDYQDVGEFFGRRS